MLVRDEKGFVKGAWSAHLTHLNSPLQAEAVACREGLRRAVEQVKSCHRNWQHAGEVVVVEVENTEVSEVGELRRERAVEDVVGEVEEAERRESGSSREDLRERRER
ncbi:hypothetical protein ACLB2K_039342 [Fragaria x ananassa]